MAPKGDLADGAILFGQPSELDRLSAPNQVEPGRVIAEHLP